jgi:hypothetical protein
VMTQSQIDEMAQLIRTCLDRTLDEVRRRGWV